MGVCIKNEQYCCKNNGRIFRVAEEPGENLEEKIIKLAKDHQEVEIKPQEIEIVRELVQYKDAVNICMLKGQGIQNCEQSL